MSTAHDDVFGQVLWLLARLEAAKISFQIATVRPGALMVSVAVPGERWEIEFMDDGSVEIEVFRSDGNIRGRREIDSLFEIHG